MLSSVVAWSFVENIMFFIFFGMNYKELQMNFCHILPLSDNWFNYVKTMLEIVCCDIICLMTHNYKCCSRLPRLQVYEGQINALEQEV